MRLLLLVPCMLAALAGPAAAQFPMPSLHFPTNRNEAPDNYRRLPFRDLGDQIRIELAAEALYDFDSGEVPTSAADYMQQTANLIFEKAKGPVQIECRSDRGQKIAERCAAVISQWLITKERLTKVKFVTTGQNKPPANRNDPPSRTPSSPNTVSIVFAKQ